MIIVIVITGIIGGMVALFLKTPIQKYTDVARRADMTDIADTALRRITRDLRLALPNSVRVTTNGAQVYLEYLETVAGGRYSAATTPADCLNTGACTALTTLGDLVSDSAGTLANGQGSIAFNAARLVVYNQYNNSGNDCATDNPSVYCGHGAPLITGVDNGAPNAAEDVIAFDPTTFYPAGGSPNNRFQIVSQPVTYVCDGAGTLWRYWGYAMQAAQPGDLNAAPLNGATRARLATHVGSCSFGYEAVATQRSGLVTLHLGITGANPGGSDETVTLYSAMHVSNQP